jgi:hypothetical protein
VGDATIPAYTDRLPPCGRRFGTAAISFSSQQPPGDQHTFARQLLA